MIGKNEYLVHSIKALAYRFKKVIKGSGDGFGTFKIHKLSRSPNEIINHMYDVANKTEKMITEGNFNSGPPEKLDFEGETSRYLNSLQRIQKVLMNTEIEPETGKRLLQGPIIDMATHIGQIAMINGLHGNKIERENYYKADLD